MKRILFFLPVLIIAAAISYADSIINDIEYFSKLFPRIESSANEKETFKYIIKDLDALDIDYTVFDFAESEGYHSFSSYIDVEIDGRIKDTLITVIPVDVEDSATDRYNGSYGIAAALKLIEHYAASPPPISMKFIFLGAEKGSGEQYPLGTSNFLKKFYPEEAAAFIYFNFEKLPSAFRIVSGANGYSTPYWLFGSVRDALKQAGLRVHHSDIEAILFRLSASGENSQIADYLAEGYPAIEITDFPASDTGESGAPNESIVSTEDLIRFYDLLLQFQNSGFPSDWDSHYLFNLSEQQYLLGYIILIMLLMMYPILRRRHFGWYMRSLLKNIWIIPVLFGLVFFLLSLSSVLITALLNGLNFPSLWEYYPLPFFIFKLTITLLAYSLLSRLIQRLPFSKRSSFYSISAIFFLVISLFVLTWIDLSLSFFAIWPLFFIFTFTLTKRPVMKFLLLLLSAGWMIYGLAEIMLLHSVRVIGIITLSPVKGNLMLALIMLPFILAAIRLDMLIHPSKKLTRFAPAFLGGLSAALLIMILTYSPFTDSNPQPVTITKIIEENKADIIRIESPEALRGITEEEILNRIIPSEQNGDLVNIEVETETFLNRKIVRTTLRLPDFPEKINIIMESEKSITLFESSYPATWFPVQNRLEIYIGKNPPVPLEFSLTLSSDAQMDYIISAEYPVAVGKQRILDKMYYIDYRKTLIKHYNNAN